MKNIMKSLMLNCDKATVLIEKGIDVGLTRMEKLQLVFHISMCSGCTNYKKQSKLIHEVLQDRLHKFENSITIKVPKGLKHEILNRLDGK